MPLVGLPLPSFSGFLVVFGVLLRSLGVFFSNLLVSFWGLLGFFAFACLVVACIRGLVACISRSCVCCSVLCTGINRVCRVFRLRAAQRRFGLLAFDRRERLEILLSSPRPFGHEVERPPSSPSPPTPVGEGSQRHDPPELFGQGTSTPRLAHH